MATLKKAEALKIIVQCAKLYKQNLANRNLLFIVTDKHKRVSGLEVTFEASNFLHLTGVVLKNSSLTALRFYERCLEHKISYSDFDLPDSSKSQQKLSVLPMLLTSNLSVNSIGEFNGEGRFLYTEKLAGNVKGCMGFVKDSSSKHMVPNTVLREDIRNMIKEPYRVILTYRKLRKDKIYSECVYRAKNVEWERIQIPEEYEYLFDMLP